MAITFLGLTLHLYGLILGLSIGAGWWLSLIQAKKHNLSVTELEKVSWWVILGGILGARFYHVATDTHLYADHWFDVFKIWQGGLSIIGAVLGGSLTAWLILKARLTTLKLFQILDVSVFGLPVAQAIGRWGNFVNQELYGPPSSLPWAIAIDPNHRLPGFETHQTYHPLFAYEMVVTLVGAGWLWWWDRRRQLQGKADLVGTGQYFWWYVVYYSIIRFGLDFLRLDKAEVALGLGLNQVVLLGVVVIGLVCLWQKRTA